MVGDGGLVRGKKKKKERAGRQVGRPGMFEHNREKEAPLEFKVKNFPPRNTWSCGQRGTNGIYRKAQIKVQDPIESLRPLQLC